MQKTKPVFFALAIFTFLSASFVTSQEVLPKPETPFQGKIGRTAAESKPDFPKGIEAYRKALQTCCSSLQRTSG